MDTLGISDALDFANIEQRHHWHNAVRRGVYTEGPSTVMGRAARFGPDDLVAAHCFGRLLDHEIRVHVAGQIANDVRRLLRELSDVRTLSAWKVASKRGLRVVVAEHAPAPGAIELFKFEIATIRELAAAAGRAKRAKDAQ